MRNGGCTKVFFSPCSLTIIMCPLIITNRNAERKGERELDCRGLVSVGASGSSVPIPFKVVI